ncbi:hypothetical protein ACX80V_12995 [Arthrobacter sp. MDT3-24]
MAITPEQQKTAKTWQTMVDSNKALLLRKTGHDVGYWAGLARSAGLKNDAELRHWMRDEHGVTGYAQYAVSWELFGYPDFMLRDADELIDGQYINHPELRPIADALRADDPFDRRVRLTAVDQVDDELLEILARALDQNT